MFTRAAPLIAQSLWQGGLSPAQSHVVTNALGQCRAPLIHRGPIQVDYSSPQMSLVTPEAAKFQFPQLQLQPPEVFLPRPGSGPPPEEIPIPEPTPFPPPAPVTNYYPTEFVNGPSLDPVALEKAWRELREKLDKLQKDFDKWKDEHPDYTGGDFIDVDDEARQIELKTESNEKGNICTFGTDEIIGKDIEELIEENSDKILEVLTDASQGTPDNTLSVLTSVRLTSSGLEFSTATITVLAGSGDGGEITVPVVDCEPSP